MYKAGFYTLGCKVSQYETEAVSEAFAARGFLICPFDAVCDIYVINTCTVTAESDRKSRQVIRRAAKTNPNALIFVMGCYSQRAPREVSEIEGVFLTLGTENKLSTVDFAEKMLAEREADKTPDKIISTTDLSDAVFERMAVKNAPRTRAYVKIEDGCESRCTYCAIAPARGRVRSKDKNDVIAEVEALYKSGTREIVLTGIEAGSYGRDFSEKYDLADLICELTERHSCDRIRLGSLAPELIKSDFVERVKDSDILAPHFHLSMQSGSDKILAAMKRRYNRRTALDVVNSIKEKINGAAFTTDLMVGFPGEDESDFLDTVSLAADVGFIDAHVFAYSRRAGTLAAEYKNQVPEKIKRERSERLIKFKNELRDSILENKVKEKKKLSVIAETRDANGFYTAHSAEYIETRFYSECGNLTGMMLDVTPVSQNDGIILCKLN